MQPFAVTCFAAFIVAVSASAGCVPTTFTSDMSFTLSDSKATVFYSGTWWVSNSSAGQFSLISSNFVPGFHNVSFILQNSQLGHNYYIDADSNGTPYACKVMPYSADTSSCFQGQWSPFYSAAIGGVQQQSISVQFYSRTLASGYQRMMVQEQGSAAVVVPVNYQAMLNGNGHEGIYQALDMINPSSNVNMSMFNPPAVCKGEGKVSEPSALHKLMMHLF